MVIICLLLPYFSVLEGDADQFEHLISKKNHFLDEKILLLCNLSSEVTEAHIRRLFKGLTKKLHAFIQFYTLYKTKNPICAF